MSLVTMTDGREVDFGKKDFVLATEVLEDGSVRVKAAFADGEYRDFTLEGRDGKNVSPTLSAYAAAGLEATLKRFLNGGLSHDFDLAAPLLPNGPAIRKPRASTGPKPAPLELALMQVTGKDLEAIRPWLASKSRKERFALSRDARVAPILASLQAAADAAKAAKKGDVPADLLADLGGAEIHGHLTINSEGASVE